MVSGLLVLFGIISYQRIGVDRFPYIEFPVISVTTTMTGASPDVIDASITSILESSVNTTPGIEHIQSSSSPGVSVTTITFSLEKDIDVAFNEVQSKVSEVLRRLPEEIDPPIVRKVETNARPIMWLALRGDRTLQQLNLHGYNVVKKQLETIDGVGEVRLGGRRDRNIRVNVMPERMVAYNIVSTDIIDALTANISSSPAVSWSGKSPNTWSSWIWNFTMCVNWENWLSPTAMGPHSTQGHCRAGRRA